MHSHLGAGMERHAREAVAQMQVHSEILHQKCVDAGIARIADGIFRGGQFGCLDKSIERHVYADASFVTIRNSKAELFF